MALFEICWEKLYFLGAISFFDVLPKTTGKSAKYMIWWVFLSFLKRHMLIELSAFVWTRPIVQTFLHHFSSYATFCTPFLIRNNKIMASEEQRGLVDWVVLSQRDQPFLSKYLRIKSRMKVYNRRTDALSFKLQVYNCIRNHADLSCALGLRCVGYIEPHPWCNNSPDHPINYSCCAVYLRFYLSGGSLFGNGVVSGIAIGVMLTKLHDVLRNTGKLYSGFLIFTRRIRILRL